MTWWKPKSPPWGRLVGRMEMLADEISIGRKEQRAGFRELLERIGKIVATVQDLRNSLQGLGDAIAAELEQLKQVLLSQGSVPQDAIDAVDAVTTKVSTLVEDAMPAPEPNPNPQPRR